MPFSNRRRPSAFRIMASGTGSWRHHPSECGRGDAHGADFATHVRLALDVTRDVPDAHVTINGATLAFDGRVSLSPRETWRWEGDDPSGKTPLQLDVTNANGQPVISHTENHFDRTPATAVQAGLSGAAASGRPARRR